jgi:hypothetical protein
VVHDDVQHIVLRRDIFCRRGKEAVNDAAEEFDVALRVCLDGGDQPAFGALFVLRRGWMLVFAALSHSPVECPPGL